MNIGRCELCKCQISFEDSQIGMVVDCPRCKNKTTLAVLDKKPDKAPEPVPSNEESPEVVIPPPEKSSLRLAPRTSPGPGKTMPRESDPTGLGLQVCSLLLLIVGLGLTLNGCVNDWRETIQKDGGSSARQTVCALQEGFGLVIISLSLVANTVLKAVRHLARRPNL